MLAKLFNMSESNLKSIISDFPAGATHRLVIQYDSTEFFLKLKDKKFYTLDENEQWILPFKLDLNELDILSFEELSVYTDMIQYIEEKKKQFPIRLNY